MTIKSIMINDREVEFITDATNDKGKAIPPYIVGAEQVNKSTGNVFRPRISGTWFVKNATAEHLAAMQKWFTDHDAASKAAKKKATKSAQKGKSQGKTSNGLSGVVAKLENANPEQFVVMLNKIAANKPALFAVANHYRTDGDTFHHKTGTTKLLNAVIDGCELSDTVTVEDGVAETLPPEVDDLFAGLGL